jgi:5-methylcytosine-specific restriction endonuclease McrA
MTRKRKDAFLKKFGVEALKQKIAKDNAAYRKRHPEAQKTAAIQAAKDAYKRQHPDKQRECKRRRRARIAASTGEFTASEWIALKAQYNNRCLCCGKYDEELKSLGRVLSPDHVVPLSRGGDNTISNIQPLCFGKGGCNNRKSTKTIDYRQR